MRRWSVAALLILPTILGILVLILGFWSYDVWSDRRHSVSVLTDTPLYVGNGSSECSGPRLANLSRGTNLKVRRIRYWKNCATLDVTLRDGRTGHIVGDGNVSITPPLGE